MGKKVREVLADKEVKLDYNLNGTQVTITAHTGESNSSYTEADVIKTHTFDAADFPSSFTTGSADVTKSLIGYGLQKLLQDRTSQVKGAAPKIDAMIAEGQRLIESGTWSELKERAASTPRARKVDTFLASAIAELKNITVAAATSAVNALNDDQRKALAASPAVIAVIERLKAEAKDTEAADLSDLL